MTIWWPKSASIQPRASLGKSDVSWHDATRPVGVDRANLRSAQVGQGRCPENASDSGDALGSVPGLKDSIGAGPNHSNFSDQNSVKILSEFRNIFDFSEF